MKNYALVNQLITSLLFAGLSCAMEPSYQFKNEEDRLFERVLLIGGHEGHHKSYKEIQCEDLIQIKNQIQINRELNTKTLPISESIRTCFQENLPFVSTDEEILKAFLGFQEITRPNIGIPTPIDSLNAKLVYATSRVVNRTAKFDTPEDKETERFNLISGFMGKANNYKEIHCEEILQIRDRHIIGEDGKLNRWMEGNLELITENMVISDQMKNFFQQNLPFASTDKEIRKALLTYKAMHFVPISIDLPIIVKRPKSEDEMTTDNACECVIF